jgi:hypothetical protein
LQTPLGNAVLSCGNKLSTALGNQPWGHFINKFASGPGRKIGIHKIKHKNPLKHKPNYWLVDQFFIMDTFAKGNEYNFGRFKLDRFLYLA